ncbi:MAG: CPBP family intramembrane glutamic endopeptidase [Bacteroidota bacterium]
MVPVLSVGIPVYWVTQVDKQPVSALGLTLRKWLPSLALSVLLSMVVVFPFFLGGARILSTAWMPMAAAGALSLFEPLFVFGWLQLRFEKDFGVLPGILLAGLGFAIYHAGYMPQAMQYQFYDAVLWAVCFRLTGSLLVTWPILWAATSAWVCLGGNSCLYNWSMVVTWGLMLLIEIAYIAFMASRQRRAQAKSVHADAV